MALSLFGAWLAWSVVSGGAPAAAAKGSHAFVILETGARGTAGPGLGWVQVNGRTLKTADGNVPHKVSLAARGLDQVVAQVGKQRITFWTRMHDGETYTVRPNPCSGVEMLPEAARAQPQGQCRFEVVGAAPPGLMLSGCGDPVEAEPTRKTPPAWSSPAVSAMCPHAPLQLLATAAGKEDASARTSFVFLHAGALTVVYDAAHPRFRLNLAEPPPAP